MDELKLKGLLQSLIIGQISADDLVERLRHLPYEDLGFAQIDHHRNIRQGQPEIIFGKGKSAEQIVSIVKAMSDVGSNVLVTRIDADKAAIAIKLFPAGVWHQEAGCFTLEQQATADSGRGTVMVISAGTSDRPVAEEAVVTLRFLGNRVEHLCDVGVAGIHRLLSRVPQIRTASVLVVVAGMEGALPSVVGGLVDRPVIAVPTSVGYGASFGGVAALLGMLNSCASGVTVVNIDNGFGAACAASRINRT